MGLILFAALFGYLALRQPAVLFGSAFLGVVGLGALAGWLAMARAYWFSRPLQGIALALILYAGGWAVALRG